MEGHFGQNGQKLHKIKKSSSVGTWGERQTNFGGSRGGSSPVPLLPLGKTLLPGNEIIQRETSAHAIILSKQR